jgi:hypothetical protein
VPAQGHDPAAGPPDVAEQQLDDRRGADVLDADGVLSPPDGVAERARPLAPRVLHEQLRDLGEQRLRDAAGLLDERGRVAPEVLLEDLVDAAGVLQGLVAAGR